MSRSRRTQFYGPKLAMTATRVREDDKLNFLLAHVGQVRTSCMWAFMERMGAIAVAHCFNVPVRPRGKEDQRGNMHACVISAVNIASYMADRGEKVIIFVDRIPVLRSVAEEMHRSTGVVFFGTVQGQDNDTARDASLSAFRRHKGGCVLAMTEVGGTGLDTPECTTMVQIFFIKSQRQHAQRMGRTLRYNEGRPSFVFTVYHANPDTERKLLESQRFVENQMYVTKRIEGFPVYRGRV